MLIGADPSHVDDRCIRVTIHHCFFDGTRQRHPRLRFGKVHLYNNYTRNWGIYAVCASVEAQVKTLTLYIAVCLSRKPIALGHKVTFFKSQVFSQCNIYEAGVKKKTFEYYPEKVGSLFHLLHPLLVFFITIIFILCECICRLLTGKK